LNITSGLCLCCLLIQSLASVAAASEDQARLDRNVNFAATARQAIVPASIDLTPTSATENDEENFVIQLRRIEYVLSEDSIERSVTRVYRYLQSDGVRDYGNVRTYFNGASDVVEIRHAMVVTSAGAIHVVEPETVQILPNDTVNVFSDSKFVLLPLTGLDTGSTAIVIDHVKTSRRDLVAPWGVSISEQYGVPQERLEVHVKWTSPDLRPEWHSELSNMSCTESHDSSLTCAATDIPAYPINSDVYYDDVVPQFVLAEKRSWTEIRNWYETLFKTALVSDASIAKMAAQLSDGLGDEVQKLKAIHGFVATQIRYVGMEHGSFAFMPHRTDLTLQRRYGDCKDKTALLIDLLKQVGINMSPVLVSTGRRDPKKLFVPSGSYFDHLIVCGALANGEEYCLDGTDPYSGIKPLGSWIQGAVALYVAEQSGPTVLPADRFGWVLDEELELTITDAGQLLEKGQLVYTGVYGSSLRSNLSALSSKELQKWAIENYHLTVSDLVDPRFHFSGMDAINESLIMGWNTEYSDLVSLTHELKYIEISAWLNSILSFLESDNDAYDYRFPGARYGATTTINVNKKWRINNIGPDVDMQSQFGSFRRSHEIEGQKVLIRTSVEAPGGVIAVGDMARFTRFLRILQKENAIRVEGTIRDDD
jgi:hypothetical protein